VRHSFRDCMPGAVLAVALWALLILCFRYYLALGFGAPTGVFSNDERITLIGHAVGAVVATAFLFYFASSAVLIGAELNAELIRRRKGRVGGREPARTTVSRSWPRALPTATTSLSAKLLARRTSNGKVAVPSPSRGRRVRVVATSPPGPPRDGEHRESPDAEGAMIRR
jgi:hypothetical protein